MQILKGDISITDNINFVKEVLYSNIPNTKVISLDENNAIPLEHPNVIGGTCLLPPIDALIAEADGDEMLFDQVYSEHFMTPFVDQFVGALIISLMRGTNILLYYPELDTNIAPKLMEQFWRRYGIGIGIINQKQKVYDESCTPMWLGYAYTAKAINGRDYLYAFPINCQIPDMILQYLIIELSPVVDNYEGKVQYIYDLVEKFKQKPDLIIPIFEDNRQRY